MEAMVVRRVVSSLFAIPDWVYGRRAAGLDLGFGALAAGWFVLMLAKPEMFDRGTFVGMDWLPDVVWTTFLAFVLLGHAAGLAFPGWKIVRVAAALLSAWFWILIASSLYRVELTTGVIAYGIFGAAALLGALYVAGLPRHGR